MLAMALALIACVAQRKENGERMVSRVEPGVIARFPFLLSQKVDSTRIPRSMELDGQVRGVSSHDWTSGFFSGTLLSIFQLTGDSSFLQKAQEWLPFIEVEKNNAGTHDMGFKIYTSIGEAFEITGNQHYRDVIVSSAKTLSTRFNPTVGSIKSWDWGAREGWQFPVIIDNMMNLELLFEATRLSGDSSFYHLANTHASTTMANHFREDNSSYHVIDYDPETGEILKRVTHQGFSDESVWSRGQAWGLYGFTMVYRYTKDKRYQEHAIKIADFIMHHPLMPDDRIPYWDMNDPAIPNAPRDASAAAVIASACYELYSQTQHQEYMNFANAIIASLSSKKYVLSSDAKIPFILDHSTGNWPKNDEIDSPINYADYYFLEALLRKRRLEKNKVLND